MNVAYVDTSCLVAIAFGEKGAPALARRLQRFQRLVASSLAEAELRSAFVREGRAWEPALLDRVAWVVPDRPLSAEIEAVLATGYLRGADCWHLAAALYLAGDPKLLAFVTLDRTQAAVARALGFK
ncbi:MAG: PIN domain-containing protein [Gemmatimonadota bacterium]|nr:PIN domain-containing protein [Gemmatimonadota bacterium]